MRNIYNSLIIGAAGLALCASVTSCEDYLEKAPETNITEAEAFKNFRSYQGFIEEVYNCIPDKEKCNWCPSWNWGDDEMFNTEADDRMTHQIDLGNFRAWSETGNWLYKSGSDPSSTNSFNHSLWPHAWYCIRKCNMAINNIDQMVGTREEKDLILGQAYFFRAWWHFELMEYFGGLPYITKVYNDGEELKEPRLKYQECADKVAEDLLKAVELLPLHWDNTVVGAETSGKNQLRVNKITALGYLGKNYLWAGSPLMEHGAQLGGLASGKTYEYNEEYCKKAADAFGELISLVESGQTQYGLVEFNFDTVTTDDYIDPITLKDTSKVLRGIYDHKRAADAKSCYSDLFYTTKQNWLMPGDKEAIMRGPSGFGGNANNSNWNTSKVFGPKVAGLVEHDNVIHQPTANLVEQYGMANGLPIDDPKSGFDPTHPFLNRDPRFYHDIVFDGFKYVNSVNLDKAKEKYRYCSLDSKGDMRSATNGSRTGYFCQKLIPHTCNIADQDYNWGGALHSYLSYMRLADIYLMYAEACAAANYQSSKCSLTALDAVNKIRKRCGAGSIGGEDESGAVLNADLTTGNKFMDEIRRERAVELSFEGFRFNDLQRWLLLTESPYNVKYAQEFTRLEDEDFFKKNDPRKARVADYGKSEILTRKFDVKHYWFPILESQTYLYPEFEQNPGW